MLARTRAGVAAARTTLRSPVILVPTMGALHDGHRALLRRARVLSGPNGSIVVTLFVNPLQFGAGEDLDRYPRSVADDIAICAREGADVVFAPPFRQMYPHEQLVLVNPGPMGAVLEGASRPGFFDGVLTVVLKLIHLTRPDVAVFGEKDAQQLALVRRMAADLNLPVTIDSVATVRDSDGLAASSRNRYLSDAERKTALALCAALEAGSVAGPHGADAVLAAAGAELAAAARADPPLAVDYLTVADPATFAAVGPGHRGEALLLVAASVGTTRLIDNARLSLVPPGPAAQDHPSGARP
ncbi:MAG: pantoate--beta-alanine ligase [Streptosporangiaceae bacterium]